MTDRFVIEPGQVWQNTFGEYVVIREVDMAERIARFAEQTPHGSVGAHFRLFADGNYRFVPEGSPPTDERNAE